MSDGYRIAARTTFGVIGICMLMFCPILVSQTEVRSPAKSAVDWVNPYIGTAGGGSDYGGTMPLVTAPFGMTNWTAQTRQNRISVTSYAWEDTKISGFIGTHQPAIWMGDYGYVTVVPEFDGMKTSPEARALGFKHAYETVTPYYYSVLMEGGHSRTLKAELTATEHCGYMRFRYPTAMQPGILVEATRPGVAGYVIIDRERKEIAGYNPDRMDAHLGPMALPNFKGYFVVSFDRPFATSTTYTGPNAHGSDVSLTGQNVGAYVSFAADEDGLVQLKIGTSFISIDQARANLEREIPAWDFDHSVAELKSAWDAKLGLIEIEGATDDQSTIFYTALYHAMLYPRLFSENGRYYSAFDDKVHNGIAYTDYSLWDTFRAEHSLLTLLAPERVGDMMQALLQDYQEGGWMPKWPNPSYTNIMIATHADAVLAEAVNKGFGGFNYRLAYEAVHKDATVPPEGDTTRKWLDREPHTPYEARAGLTYLKDLGYVPADKTAEAASSTLEDDYDDYAGAEMAKAIGNVSDYQFFLKRSLNYQLLFNRETGFMQARNSDGSWAAPDVGWTEGDRWAYTWAVMHDVPGLIDLMGGRDAFNRKLDEHFAGGHNKHDNEPSHHYPYLYDYSGQPWKVQSHVREIETQAYSNTPAGMLGNEDCGQMSAWYIFSAMGFYPVNPVSGDYMIGSPLFKAVKLHLANAKTLIISAPGNSERNMYIQAAELNGQRLTIPVLRWDQLQKGGTLNLEMGPRPSTWGVDWYPSPLKP